MKLNLLLGLHSHQPIGNFDYVFEDAFRHAYLPFIEVLERYPDFKVTLHYTGPLLLWMKEKRPEFLERLRELGRRHQVEFVVSGFYEPVLLLIPEEDRLGQIGKFVEFARQELSADPSGLWLTERVWESELIGSLVKAGIDYAVVDDFHFKCAGLTSKELRGYYLTESGGKTLAIFPIDERLRYLIPFRSLDEVMGYLWEIKEGGGKAAIIFDDGEKFGLWPGTHRWVYEEGWLRDFIEAVLKADWIETATFGEFLRGNSPLGRIYLPSNSYFEMGEWSLPPGRALDFRRLMRRLKETGLEGLASGFVRGGIFQNFLVKYSESNRMHKKMLLVRKDVEKLRGRKKLEALDYVHRAQCNDAYWHGIFGGLYLPHLRREVYRNLLRAESLLGDESVRTEDVDADGREEIYVRSRELILQVRPSYGGSLSEISLLNPPINLVDTLRRRFEHYHEGIGEGADGEIASIHEIPKEVDERTRDALVYDDHDRLCFLDHFYEALPSAEELMRSSPDECGNFHLSEYSFRLIKDGVELEREGKISSGSAGIRKRFQWEKGLRAFYSIRYTGGSRLFFGVELNLSLPTPGVEGTYLRVGEEIYGTDRLYNGSGADSLEIRDKMGFRVSIKLHPRAYIRVYPVYTVSQSESGFDLTYQETCIVFLWEVEGGSEKNMAVDLSFIPEGGKYA